MNLILFLVGLGIYASYGLGGMAFLAFSLLTSYIAARFVKGRKWVMILTVAVNAAVLIFVKALPYTDLTPIAPFGISYYTFQVISYLVALFQLMDILLKAASGRPSKISSKNFFR